MTKRDRGKVELETENRRLRDEVNGLKTEVNDLKTEVNENRRLRDEVNGLKTEVNGLKSEVNDLKSEVNKLQKEIENLKGLLNIHINKINFMIESHEIELIKAKNNIDFPSLVSVCLDELKAMSVGKSLHQNRDDFVKMKDYDHRKFIQEVASYCPNLMEFLMNLFEYKSITLDSSISGAAFSILSKNTYSLAFAVAAILQLHFTKFTWEYSSGLMHCIRTLTQSSLAVDLVGMVLPGGCLCRTLENRIKNSNIGDYEKNICDQSILHMVSQKSSLNNIFLNM